MSIKSCLDFSIVNKLNRSLYLVNDKFKQLKIIHKYSIDFDPEHYDEDISTRIEALNKKCAHKYIVNIDSSFTAEDTMYLVLQYCEGGSMRDLINRVVLYGDVLHESEIMDWFCQLIIAIVHLNENDFALSCINPRKIFFKNNSIKLSITEIVIKRLADKNIKKIEPSIEINNYEEEDDEDEENMKSFHELYLSPEQCYNTECPIDFDTSSSWSLGCILYELCSLKKLFKNKSEIVDFKDNQDDFNQFISSCSNSIVSGIRDIFLKIMQYNPKDRLPTSMLLKEKMIHEYIEISMDDRSSSTIPEDDLKIKTPLLKINETLLPVHRCETNHDNFTSEYTDNYSDDGVDDDCLTTDDITEIISSL